MSNIDNIKMEIAGEIALSPDPGITMKKWREIFNIKQIELAKKLNISISTISDYEGGRRKSPGTKIIKRFVDALIEIDIAKGGNIIERLSEGDETEHYFNAHEFARPVLLKNFVELINGEVLTNEDLLDKNNIYGYTIINSIRTIMEIKPSNLPKIYGLIPERALIFTSVSSGRSPAVVVRIGITKPSALVIHGVEPKKVDKLAIKLTEKDRVPLIITNMDLGKIRKSLEKI